MNLILFGLPSSGKTTIGKTLAAQLSLSFIDTDRIIEDLHRQQYNLGYSCRKIYQTYGESKFRLLESESIFSLQNRSNTIISLGGGSICHSENLPFLQDLGELVQLQISKQTLYSRLLLNPPAFLNKTNFDTFYEYRVQCLKRIPSHIIDIDDKNLAEIIQILSTLYNRINSKDYGQ